MISRLTGWLTLFLIGTDLFVVSPLLPDIAHSVGLSSGTAGMTVTVFSLAYLVGGPTIGAVADRRGRTLVLSVALLVFGLSNLLTSLAPDAAVLLLSRALAGLAAAGVTPSVYALIGAAAPPAKRATWLAVVTSGLLLALATGAPLGSLLAQIVEWRGVFAVLAVATLAILAVIRWQGRHTTTGATAGGATAATPTGNSDLAAPTLWARLRAVAVTTLWALSVYGLYTYLGSILTGRLHASELTVVLVLVAYGLGAVAGNLLGGRLADAWGARPTSVASLTGLTAAMVAVAFALLSGVVMLLLALLAVGLLAYPYFAAQQARLAAAFPASSGQMIAWNNSAMYAGILIGSALGGTVVDAFGPSALAWCSAGIGALAALLALVSTPRAATATDNRTPGPSDAAARDHEVASR